MDRFHDGSLLVEGVHVSDPPAPYPVYAPGYYAVFFDDPHTGIHWELAHTPLLPSPAGFLRWVKALKAEWRQHPEWKQSPMKAAMRKLPRQGRQAKCFSCPRIGRKLEADCPGVVPRRPCGVVQHPSRE